jgi:hypothetical protein
MKNYHRKSQQLQIDRHVSFQRSQFFLKSPQKCIHQIYHVLIESKLASKRGTYCCTPFIKLFKVAALFHSYLLGEIDSIYHISKQHKLGDLGYRIGSILSHRLSLHLPPFSEAKEAVKYICKDLWFYLFKQQASRLQANKKGIFVIHDSSFPPLHTLSKCTNASLGDQNSHNHVAPLSHASSISRTGDLSPTSPPSAINTNSTLPKVIYERGLSQIQLTVGIIKGFLETCGFLCSVDGVLPDMLPACAFQINVTTPGQPVFLPKSPGNFNSDGAGVASI